MSFEYLQWRLCHLTGQAVQCQCLLALGAQKHSLMLTGSLLCVSPLALVPSLGTAENSLALCTFPSGTYTHWWGTTSSPSFFLWVQLLDIVISVVLQANSTLMLYWPLRERGIKHWICYGWCGIHSNSWFLIGGEMGRFRESTVKMQ